MTALRRLTPSAHAFKDACRPAGMNEEVHDALTGHSNGGVGRSYGRGGPVVGLAAAMAYVAYPGLDLLNGGAAQ
jgi:predicted secreted Zn-dependent protease